MSKKEYPSDAASFLPTDDFPVPIIPTRKRLDPSRASLTSLATSSAAPSAEARGATRARRAGSARVRAGSARVRARGGTVRRAGATAAWTTLMAISDGDARVRLGVTTRFAHPTAKGRASNFFSRVLESVSGTPCRAMARKGGKKKGGDDVESGPSLAAIVVDDCPGKDEVSDRHPVPPRTPVRRE